MKLQILGTGCSRCKTLADRVHEAITNENITAEIEKIEDFKEIVRLGIMSTPALLADGKVLCTGRVPTVRELTELLQQSLPPSPKA